MAKNRGLTFKEFQWVFFFFVLTTAFVGIFAWRYLTNCIFEWPVRFDVRACWNEQVEPSKQGAFEKASDFLPELKFRK